MNCDTCHNPISAQRLAAMPGATQCVPCLERDGDVERVKRYDDYVGDEKEEVHFTVPDQYLDTVLRRNGSIRMHPFFQRYSEQE